MPVSPRERILAIKLMEYQERNPEYASRIGIQVNIIRKGSPKLEDKNV